MNEEEIIYMAARQAGKTYMIEEFKKIYEEKDKEIDRLNNIISELENYCWELKAMGCREGALDMLDRIKALKEDNNV